MPEVDPILILRQQATEMDGNWRLQLQQQDRLQLIRVLIAEILQYVVGADQQGLVRLIAQYEEQSFRTSASREDYDTNLNRLLITARTGLLSQKLRAQAAQQQQQQSATTTPLTSGSQVLHGLPLSSNWGGQPQPKPSTQWPSIDGMDQPGAFSGHAGFSQLGGPGAPRLSMQQSQPSSTTILPQQAPTQAQPARPRPPAKRKSKQPNEPRPPKAEPKPKAPRPKKPKTESKKQQQQQQKQEPSPQPPTTLTQPLPPQQQPMAPILPPQQTPLSPMGLHMSMPMQMPMPGLPPRPQYPHPHLSPQMQQMSGG